MGTAMRVIAALAVAAAIAPAGAQAQGNDPGAGSPAGTIYEIPLDSARDDAAPRDRSAAAAIAREVSPASPIHSEDNGFGSSAQVPGAPATPDAAGGNWGVSEPEIQQVDAGARSAHTSPAALLRPAARASAPSSTRAYVLLVLAIGVAAALGVAARLAARRR